MTDGLVLVLSESSLKKLTGLEPVNRTRIAKKLKEYQDKPLLLEADIKRLSGTRDPVLYRIRIGDYRVIGSVQARRFEVLDIRHRSSL
ncbi:MAG: hypothetical protein KKF41_14820 [Actinobacteria bacterium]|nr:hypothetical protein [Actinomycetota bacterium]MBU1944758.1 hypothetical protein [Actinomycetota bacterium]MBU2688849.1 hypothetical protein [Actinomycetota bacterium]